MSDHADDAPPGIAAELLSEHAPRSADAQELSVAPVVGAGWIGLAAEVQGAFHRHRQIPRQDAAAAAAGLDASRQQIVVVAVADGHGGRPHFRSRVGANLATAVAVDVLRAHPATSGPGGDRELAAALVSRWLGAVASDVRQHELTDAEIACLQTGVDSTPCADPANRWAEAYGSTLLAASATSGSLRVVTLGDGAVVAVRVDGSVLDVIEEAAAGRFGVTASLCGEDAANCVRIRDFASEEDLPALVLLCTDGFSDSFDRSQLHAHAASFLDLLQTLGPSEVATRLPQWLREVSDHGSGDDVSVALLVRDSALPGARSAQSEDPDAPGRAIA